MSRSPRKRDPGEGSTVVSSADEARFFEIACEPSFFPPADIHETSRDLVLRIELPGVPAEAVAVHVTGETIEVSGVKDRDPSGEEASFLCVERSHGRFHRTFELSGSFDMGRVSAALRDGILVLTVPKCEERRGRRRRVPVARRESR